jgi:complex iron-sulfur molybdoenzyme family reductase subunit alpha
VLPGNAPLIIEPGRTTMASVLQQAGYRTGVVGKWHLGLGRTNLNWNSEIKPGQAYTPFQHQVEEKRPWRTLTGRQQFYLDHPWFLDFGEQLPVYKEPLSDSAKYPFFWNTPHGRWSIHSTWRDARYQLRLQRGIPICYIHPEDAKSRNIQDNDWVKVFNDNGSFVSKVQILPGEKRKRLTMYHGWERYLWASCRAGGNPHP